MPYMDNDSAGRFVRLYSDMILRICYLYLKQTQDAEDICQDVFLKLLLRETDFTSLEHEKAWIIRTTINSCKDHLRRAFFRKSVPLETARELSAPAVEESYLLDKVLQLLEKYRISLFLYYYEGYKVYEIAELLGKQPNTVSAYLSRGKRKLKAMIENERQLEQEIIVPGEAAE